MTERNNFSESYGKSVASFNMEDLFPERDYTPTKESIEQHKKWCKKNGYIHSIDKRTGGLVATRKGN